MRWWAFLLILLFAVFIVFWPGHQGHVGLGAHLQGWRRAPGMVHTFPCQDALRALQGKFRAFTVASACGRIPAARFDEGMGLPHALSQ